MICGIDLGSRNVKVALMDKDGGLSFRKFDTVSFYRKHGKSVNGELLVDLEALGIGLPEKIVATGYGRQTINLKGADILPEIKAHVLGAIHQTGLSEFTLLDLGGQDSKVVLVSKGRMMDFQTNDKCAASTGRYLENMAAVLDIDMDELAYYDENPVDLNSTCAIFGETELIGKVVEGHPISALGAGVNYTIFKRIKPMLSKLLTDTIVFTGGVAHSQALVKIIENEMKVPVVVPQHPQYNGAIGCCAFALG
ncbi:putative CoA-substrate-specific enzyme activase [Desulforamulus reducens MI-1]|uniref:Putative CoA-substrate-specific enzyme activase n=1 Tax=Desulforamulus reducens (strain ATCC BAA-1160 / DSM 100696 / MI-1) TaxID=349161 RepID=A4J7Z0_DESRM|nr:acyl-CoA dehydratase activase [Desulforamulus reducens]ABO51193.1 putative CoA-substrate-specific enzyme activase [Desulforamulus reducens MI-1]